MLDKSSLRRWLCEEREKLALATLRLASINLFHILKDSLLLDNAQNIAFYIANKGEIDPFLLLQKSIQLGKKCFLPVMTSQKQALDFFQYKPEEKMIKSKYGFYEPKRNGYIEPSQLELVFLPMVAFDLNFHRLGKGKGFYDKTFQFKNNSSKIKPLLIGIAYEFQKVESIPVDHWDVKLDGIATEERLYFNKT